MFVPAPAWGPGVGRNAGETGPHATLAAQGPLPPKGAAFCLGAARRQKKAPTLGAVRRRKPRSPLAVRRSIIAAAPKKRAPGGMRPMPGRAAPVFAYPLGCALHGPGRHAGHPGPCLLRPLPGALSLRQSLTGRAAPDWPRRSGFRWPRRRFTD
ncbi:MAG: hypothetical protein DI604_10240 [Delftia acidovorans]|nr:MAG: hypothetical protein DI604_10240 [Delftia acidovorans]